MTTKDYVIAELINSDSYISGEALSSKLGITRAAINSAVKSLKSEGYDIESSTRKGYLLVSKPDKISSGELLAYISNERMRSVYIFDEIDSTNKYLKELGSEGAEEGTVVIADYQTRGRGRLGRSFASPHGVGIYFSYLIRPQSRIDEISTITAWTAVAIVNAIKNVTGITPDIKWVNDLLINDKKICGILTELSVESESGHIDNVVVGIGINVNHEPEDFPIEIRDIASSIAHECGTKIIRAKLAAEMIKEMDKLVSNWGINCSSYIDDYRKHCITTGKDVSCVSIHTSNESRRGKALMINDDFSIKVQFEDGSVEDLSSGEVSIRGLYGYT